MNKFNKCRKLNYKKIISLLVVFTIVFSTAPLTLAEDMPSGVKIEPGKINTIAGNSTMGYSGDGEDAVSAQLGSPIGVAVDKSGNIYIGDANYHVIRKVDKTTGKISTISGNGIRTTTDPDNLGDGGPATEATLNNPYGVAVDDTGNIYIADVLNHRIRKVDTDGKISTVAGTGEGGYSEDGVLATEAKLNEPAAVLIGSDGNLYIADKLNHRIRKVDTDGKISTVAGTGEGGYSGDGEPAIEAQLNQPTAVVIDSIGNLYIADMGNHCIRKVNTDGKISTVAGTGEYGYSGDGGPAVEAQLNNPFGVAVDSNDNIYVSDMLNNRIRKIDSNGKISTIAGNGENFGINLGDGGLPANAIVGMPFHIAVDIEGNIYIANEPNRRIRVVGVGNLTDTYTINVILDQTLTDLTVGYASGSQETKSVTITRTGTGNLENLTVALDSGDTSSFIVTQPTGTTLNSATPSTNFTVKAKDGLSEGIYTATVKISADNMADVTFTVAQAVNSGSGGNEGIKVGDYIQFGKYNNEPILWRVINIDDSGSPLLFSENILSLKAFDSKGGTHSSTGQHEERNNLGSNNWEYSNIRQWLNSSDTSISWLQNPPSTDNVWANPYDTESGFLSYGNFSKEERNLIKPVTHKILLADIDQNMKDGGSESYSFESPKLQPDALNNSILNYDNAYHKMVTDYMFLLSVKELKEHVADRGFDYTRKPTDDAINKSIFKHEGLSASKKWWYWLSTPSPKSSHDAIRVCQDGVIDHFNVGNGDKIVLSDGHEVIVPYGAGGIVPACYLDANSLSIESGEGSYVNPYKFTGTDPQPIYTISYNGNGNTSGTAPTDSSSYEEGASVTVPGNTGNLARTGFTFAGWNTQADGKGTDYAAGSTYTMGSSNITLYAKWIENVPQSSEISPVTATFDKKAKAQADIIVTMTLNGDKLNGISLGGTVLTNGTQYSINGNQVTFKKEYLRTLTAGTATIRFAFDSDESRDLTITIIDTTPADPTYTVSYNGNGNTSGTAPTDSSSYEEGAIVTVPGNTGNLAKTGYTFAGWNTQADGKGTDYAAGSAYTMGSSNITLYAKWTANYTPPIPEPTPAPPPAPIPTTVTGNVVDEKGQSVKGVEAKVITEVDGTKTVGFNSNQALVVENNSKVIDYNNTNKLSFIPDNAGISNAASKADISIKSDGTIEVKNLPKGTEVKYRVTYDLGNGQKVNIGSIDIKVSENGDVSLTSQLIDPYGVITDAATGKVIEGAHVILYYANTERNIKAGKTPNTEVQLPILEGFKPNDNKNPQYSDKEGAYAFMVFPTTDYYITVTKDGYERYVSPIISVEQEIVKWDISMDNAKPVITLKGEKYITIGINGTYADPGATASDYRNNDLTGDLVVINNVNTSKAGDYEVIYNVRDSRGVVAATVKRTVHVTEQAVKTIILAGTTDSISGSVLASKTGGIILDPKDYTHIKDYKSVSMVYILGGNKVISNAIEKEVKGYGIKNVIRLGGVNAYETSQLIAKHLKAAKGTPIILMSNKTSPELIKSAVANNTLNYPIIYTTSGKLDRFGKQSLLSVRPSSVYVVGDTKAISNAQVNEISRLLKIKNSQIIRIK